MKLFSFSGRWLLSLAAGYAMHLACDAHGSEALPRTRLPDQVVDLRTTDGAALVNAQWRYREATIRTVAHRDVGPDLKATGPANQTSDFEPDARAADFDDSTWETIRPDSLEQRRGHGRLSLAWYRLSLTIPETLGGRSTRGSTVVFEVVVDDYAEVWVNGRLPYVAGQGGGAVVAGWNAPNRVVLTRDARPGERFHIAVLGINGPLSAHPDTYLWVRGATLDFYAPGNDGRGREAGLQVARLDSALDRILPAQPRLEKIAEGFAFTEGPVWVPAGTEPAGPRAAEGHLLFSDPNNNLVYRLTEDGEVAVALTKSGYAGPDIGDYRQPGSNGLGLDREGRLTLCQHGYRRVIRIESNGLTTVLADRFEGRRLNSPNDLVYRSDGALYFTDPPFGLPRFHDDPRRELAVAGVYVLKDGRLRQVSAELGGPNGLAFSPTEEWLYVGNWDEKRKIVMRHRVSPDGGLEAGEAFCDLTAEPGDDAIDGIKVDRLGHVYVSGPGGLWILNAEGQRLGLLKGPEHPHNLAWGGADRRTLYLTAQTSIYRIRLQVAGAGS